MSNFLHKREHLNAGCIVEVDCSHQCNIVLLDDSNFSNYKNGRQFTHHGGGGLFKRFPARLQVPNTGYWNIVLDLGGGSANIRHSIRFIG